MPATSQRGLNRLVVAELWPGRRSFCAWKKAAGDARTWAATRKEIATVEKKVEIRRLSAETNHVGSETAAESVGFASKAGRGRPEQRFATTTDR